MLRTLPTLLPAVLLSLLAALPPACAHAWTAQDLLYAESAMYIVDNAYFSGRCMLIKPHTTLCNPDRLLDRTDAWHVDMLIGEVARGNGGFWLRGLDAPRRGRFVAVVVVEDVAADGAPADAVPAFAESVYRQWLLLKCGQPQWSGCSNSVVIAVVTKRRAVSIYAGETEAAQAMEGDLRDVELRTEQILNEWDDDSLTKALLVSVKAVGNLTKFVDDEPEDSTSYTFASILLVTFMIAALSAIRGLRDLRDSPAA